MVYNRQRLPYLWVMLLTLGVWLWALWILLPFGAELYRIVNPQKASVPLFEGFVVGAFGWVVVLNYFSLLMPICWEMSIVAALVSLGCVVWGKGWRRLDWEAIWPAGLSGLAMCIVAVACLVFCVASEPDNGMNSIYHLSTLKLNESTALPYGIANLNSRFGYNHTWLLVQSLVRVPFVSLSPADDINGLLLLLFVASLLRNHTTKLGLWWAGLLAAPLVFIFAATSSPDMPANLLLAWLLLRLADFWEVDKMNGQQAWADLGLLGWLVALLVSTKLFSVFIVVPWFYALWLYRPHSQSDAKAWLSAMGWRLALVMVLVVGWFARFYVATGYLVYPFEQLDFFSADWKMPSAILEWEQVTNTYVGRTAGFGANDDWNIEGKGFWFWFMPWLKGKSLGYMAGLVLALGWALWLFVNPLLKGKWKLTKPTSLTVLWIVIGMAFWFYQSPNPRYIVGYLIVLMVVSGAYIIRVWPSAFQPGSSIGKNTGYLVAGVIFGSSAAMKWTKMQGNWLMQMPYHQPTVTEKKLGPMTIAVPVKSEIGCWGTALPCSDTLFLGLEPRGNNWEDGFRVALSERR